MEQTATRGAAGWMGKMDRRKARGRLFCASALGGARALGLDAFGPALEGAYQFVLGLEAGPGFGQAEFQGLEACIPLGQLGAVGFLLAGLVGLEAGEGCPGLIPFKAQADLGVLQGGQLGGLGLAVGQVFGQGLELRILGFPGGLEAGVFFAQAQLFLLLEPRLLAQAADLPLQILHLLFVLAGFLFSLLPGGLAEVLQGLAGVRVLFFEGLNVTLPGSQLLVQRFGLLFLLPKSLGCVLGLGFEGLNPGFLLGVGGMAGT